MVDCVGASAVRTITRAAMSVREVGSGSATRGVPLGAESLATILKTSISICQNIATTTGELQSAVMTSPRHMAIFWMHHADGQTLEGAIQMVVVSAVTARGAAMRTCPQRVVIATPRRYAKRTPASGPLRTRKRLVTGSLGTPRSSLRPFQKSERLQVDAAGAAPAESPRGMVVAPVSTSIAFLARAHIDSCT